MAAETTIPVRSHDEAILVLGPYDRFAKLLRKTLDIEIYNRRGNLRLKGAPDDVEEARRRIEAGSYYGYMNFVSIVARKR